METGTTAPETIEPSPNGSSATAPPSEAPPEGAVPEASPAENQSQGEMFKFAEYVHVGPGAATCEDRENGSCGNPLHFHAWCRLPNQFQAASIREKALGAKARKARQLRDPETDVHHVLEAELDRMRDAANATEAGKQLLVDDLLGQSFWRDHLTAVRELAEQEEWATIEEDVRRLDHLRTLSEDQRPADEFGELQRHVDAYEDALKARREEEQRPQREALEAAPVDELIVQIRDARIDAECNEDFMRVYSMWEWYIGTLKPRPTEKGLPVDRVFGSIEHLQQAAPEVIEELQRVFTGLEQAMGSRSAVGNS